MEKVKRNKNLQLLLTESEMNMVNLLRAHLGDISRSDVVRDCIRDKYKRESDYIRKISDYIRKMATFNKKFNKS